MKSRLPIIGGCSCGLNGCLGIILVNLLFGSACAKYFLIKWLPTIHAYFPAFNTLDPHTSVWSIKMMILGLIGGELFIPGAIITWLLTGLGILH